MIGYIKYQDKINNLEQQFLQNSEKSYFANLSDKNYILSYSFYNELLNKTIQADLYQIKKTTKTSQGYLNIQFSVDNYCMPCLITKFPSIAHISTTINKMVDNKLVFNKINVHKIFERILNWRIKKEEYLQHKQYQIVNTNRCTNFKFYIPDNILKYEINNDKIIISDYLSGDTYFYTIKKQQDEFFNQNEFIQFMFYIELLFAFSSYDIYFNSFRFKILQLYKELKNKYPQLQIGFLQKNFNIYALLNTQEDFELLINKGMRVYTNIKLYFTHPEHNFTINTIMQDDLTNFKTCIN